MCIWLLNTEPDRKSVWTSSPTDCDNRGTYIYQRIFTDTTPVDIAFLGSSHTINGIQDTLITRLLKANNVQQHHAVNLGYCRFGPEMQYVIAKDLFAHKKPKTVVVEIGEKFSAASHPMYPYYAQTDVLLHQPSLKTQTVVPNYYNGFLARLTDFRRGLYGVADTTPVAFPPYGYRGYPDAISDDSRLMQPAPESNYNMNAWRRFETDYTREWITALAELCHAHNAQLVFLYVPAYKEFAQPVEGMDFYPSLAPVWLIDAEAIHEKQLWRDEDHLNDAGAARLSDFVLRQLLSP